MKALRAELKIVSFWRKLEPIDFFLFSFVIWTNSEIVYAFLMTFKKAHMV